MQNPVSPGRGSWLDRVSALVLALALVSACWIEDTAVAQVPARNPEPGLAPQLAGRAGGGADGCPLGGQDHRATARRTGLLLEVKKSLVREAFAQGRLGAR